MIINSITEPFEHIIIENTFEEGALNDIWQEILFLQPRMSNDTVSAKTPFGVRRKSGVGIFVHEIILDPKYSYIYFHTRNLIGGRIKEIAYNMNHYFKLYRKTNRDSLLVQSYRNGDYYLPHTDEFIFTAITLMYKEPKKFDGGNLNFPTYNYTPKLKNNTTIIFPSAVLHEVDEVKMDSNDPADFRYTISMFLDNAGSRENQE